VLDGFPSDLFSKSHLFVLHILLMAARKIINWMKVQEPTVTEWTHRLKHIFEKMTADLQLKSDIFERILSICLK